MITALEDALREIQAAIDAHLKAQPELKEAARRLQQVPGVGARNVLPLLVLLWRWRTLTDGQGSAKGLVAFAGLDPVTFTSGTSVRGRGTISRQGDRRLRALLYMGALGGVRGHNALRAFYQSWVARGKAKKLALVAAARKILVWAWAVFRDHADFTSSVAAAGSAFAA
jgi:transposase